MRLIRTNMGNLLVKVTAEVNGTSDLLQIGEVDGLKLVVASNLESTVDGLQDGHADVVQLGVVVEDKVTSGGEVGSAEVGEGVTPETELTAESLERGDGDTADVTEGHVGTGAEVGQDNLQGVHVTSEVDQTSGVGELVDVDGLQVGVLGDVEGTDSLEGDTIQAGKTSVGDGDTAGLGNTLGEVKGLQLGESSPGDGANAGEVGQAEGGESGETVQLEGVANGAQGGGAERGDVAAAGAAQSTSDGGDTVEGEVTRGALADLDITLEGGAGGVAVKVTLAGDGDGAAAATTAYIVISHCRSLLTSSRLSLVVLTGSHGGLGRSKSGEGVFDESHCLG